MGVFPQWSVAYHVEVAHIEDGLRQLDVPKVARALMHGPRAGLRGVRRMSVGGCPQRLGDGGIARFQAGDGAYLAAQGAVVGAHAWVIDALLHGAALFVVRLWDLDLGD